MVKLDKKNAPPVIILTGNKWIVFRLGIIMYPSGADVGDIKTIESPLAGANVGAGAVAPPGQETNYEQWLSNRRQNFKIAKLAFLANIWYLFFITPKSIKIA